MKVRKEILINTPPIYVFAALLIPLRIVQWRKGYTDSTFDYFAYINGHSITLRFSETYRVKNEYKKIDTELLDIAASSYLSIRYIEKSTHLLINYTLTPLGNSTSLQIEQTIMNTPRFFKIAKWKRLSEIMITDDDLTELKEYTEHTLFFPFPIKGCQNIN